MKKLLLFLTVLVLLVPSSGLAEIFPLGDTPCLLQSPSGEEDPHKRYVYFVGSGDYFNAVRNCKDITAADAYLLIPQGDEKYQKPSAASDVVIRDLYPFLLAWAQGGYDLVLIGYSSGGYPATVLAASLAEAGFTGKLYILDGVYGDYRGVTYNAEYYRTRLSSWDLTIWASSDREVPIAERTRKVGVDLYWDDFVTYAQYSLTHNALQHLLDVIINGAAAPEPLPPPEPPETEAP